MSSSQSRSISFVWEHSRISLNIYTTAAVFCCTECSGILKVCFRPMPLQASYHVADCNRNARQYKSVWFYGLIFVITGSHALLLKAFASARLSYSCSIWEACNRLCQLAYLDFRWIGLPSITRCRLILHLSSVPVTTIALLQLRLMRSSSIFLVSLEHQK